MHLTPRSKVKAMLAALDDDSDNSGENAISVSYSPSTKLSAAISTEDPFLNNSVAEALSAENEEEDEEVVKPRGRLAARMLTVQSDVFDDHSTETARDRVRRMLLAEQQKEPENSRTHHITSDESEDNRVPVKSRKRKMMKLRKSTPQSSPTKSNDESREGLFVSPSRHRSSSQRSNNSSSEDDLPNNPNTNPRFIALIARKREERLAKDAEAERQKAERAARYHEELDDEVEDGDDEAGRRLTQQARPTRKAGKKALEEMHRETQRMSRNMQLAHEARTRKKITKSSLFAKFNYKPAGLAEDEVDLVENRSSSPASHTDADMKDTPPTSPLSDTGNPRKTYNAGANHHATRTELPYSSENNGDNMDHPTFQQAIFSSPPPLASKTDKGKGKSVIEPYSDILVQSVRIRDPSPVTKYFQLPKITASQDDDSDSDLEIIAAQTPLPKTKKDSIFDRVPAKQAKESHSLHALRMLAHLTSPGNQANRRNAKPSITATEMQFSLQQLARQQATREREERLQNLRDRGVIVQTAQERDQELAEVEDLMAKARREGEEIMKREKDAAKKQRKLNGEEDPLGECSDDDDWQEEKEASTDEHSGSSSENEDDEGDMSVDEEEKGRETDKSNLKSQLIDNEASESEVSDTERDSVNNTEAANLNDDDEEMGPTVQPRRRMQHRILSDDEDDEVVSVAESPVAPRTVSPASRHIRSPVAPLSVLRSATKTFIPGLTVSGPAGLGLTQIFAGTMDDSQTQDFLASNFRPHSPSQQIDGAEDSLAFLRRLPAPKLPKFEPTMDDDSQDIVMDSQTQISQIPGSQPAEDTSQGIQLQFSQSQVHEFDTPMLDFPATQYSEYPTPTQDAGFQTMSPIKGRFVEPPPSTIETVVLHATPALERVKDSPVTKKKGRLQRRAPVVAESEDDEPQGDKQTTANNDDEFDISANVFDAMRNASRKKVTINDFNKKKSGAKEMVHEQAEESEDEYAGLGGNSDDESGGEEDEFVRQMIDDEGGKDVDESALAAFYA
jgi:mediator of replication checkpoint protein 1